MTLVFPTAYLNNPASMFGHTLLRIDAHERQTGSGLLAYAINYGANTEGEGGALFMLKGLTGGYWGYFSIAPYYTKVREYSDLQDRDIWEFRLDLDAEEVRRVVEHLWELRGVRFEYYFFSDNCAYQLLTLLDVARPSLRLAEQFEAWVIPADTLRALADSGILGEAVLRPAAGTRLGARALDMDAAQVSLARALAEAPSGAGNANLARLEPHQQVAVLGLAYDYAYYQHLAGRERPASAARLDTLLRARARLDVPAAPPPAVAANPPMVRPDRGHRSAMASLGLGRSSADSYQLLRVRPAYHDLLDPGAGYKRGAQINLLDLTVRVTAAEETLDLQDFTLLDIVSLAPRNRLLRPLSWQLSAGWERKLSPLDEEPALTGQLEGGAGLAWAPGAGSTLFAMGVLAIDGDSDFEQGYALGPGLRAGAIWSPAPSWNAGLFAGLVSYRAGELFERRELHLDLRRAVDRSNLLNLVVRGEQVPGIAHGEALLAWRHFF